jgi:hypothetical protein
MNGNAMTTPRAQPRPDVFATITGDAPNTLVILRSHTQPLIALMSALGKLLNAIDNGVEVKEHNNGLALIVQAKYGQRRTRMELTAAVVHMSRAKKWYVRWTDN